ncbi:unnamed protein product [Blepharisma stoltei]|uniref:Uncharacterized protein n=1 Tax=Blepharisma stoltei TaxID=1481888 RepID=A0AAU9KDY1_9CILI|nr:unnamed protein product [Blepharisma stoltei]
MGLLDPYKETLESWESYALSSINQAAIDSQIWLKSQAEQTKASFKSGLAYSIEWGKIAYKEEKEDLRRLYRSFRPDWFDYFNVIKVKRTNFLKDAGIADRIVGFVFVSALIFGLSHGIRPRIRNTLIFGTIGGAFIVPELINPFNRV